MNKDYFVLLVGTYSNAGDYLIVHRAKQLLKSLRPDRDVVVLDRSVNLKGDVLELVNSSKALLFAGGPAVRSNIWPKVAVLCDDLNDIKVPILFFGVGWKDSIGGWQRAFNFRFTPESRSLIEKVGAAGYPSSVRDYHSFRILKSFGLDNVVLTGCPALYRTDDEVLEKNLELYQQGKNKIVVSPGVSYLSSELGFHQIADLVAKLRNALGADRLAVAFHHSTDVNELSRNYSPKSPHIKGFTRTRRLLEILEAHGVKWFDVSGGLEKFYSLYAGSEGHIGFRVHGHVLAVTLQKSSVLIAEDNRALSFKDLISGAIFDGNVTADPSQMTTTLAQHTLLDEIAGKTRFTETSRQAIGVWRETMNEYIMQLP